MLHLVNDEILDLLLNRYKNEIFYLGRIYGSETKLPCGSSILARVRQVLVKLITLVCLENRLWQICFGKNDYIGLCEARRHGYFILDPQGEFALAW